MLAWAPAIDKILKDRGVAATLVVTSACPPLVGMANDIPACEQQNARLVANLPNVDAVVMAAAWFRYQDGENNGRVRFGSETTGIVKNGLPRTVAALLDYDVELYVIGPVPAYELSVPYLYASQAMNGLHGAGGKSADDHHRDNREFYAFAKHSPSPVKVIDPAEWICKPGCAVGLDSDVFYRDDSHLSVHGAIYYSGDLANALAPLFADRLAIRTEQ